MTLPLEIVNRITIIQNVSGVLVYGSHANGTADSNSDIDLIYVTMDQSNRHYYLEVDGVDVDIYASTYQFLEKTIRSDSKNNSNFVLNAMKGGSILIDRNEELQSLTNIAKEVWEIGPSLPSISELKSLGAGILKMNMTAKKLLHRIEISSESREMVHIQFSYFFEQIVYAYCKVHGLWASTLWEMIGWGDFRYLDLIAMCRRYLCSSDYSERATALNDLTEVVLSKIAIHIRT